MHLWFSFCGKSYYFQDKYKSGQMLTPSTPKQWPFKSDVFLEQDLFILLVATFSQISFQAMPELIQIEGNSCKTFNSRNKK